MATGGDIIKEYVVSIRYNVDDSDLKKANKDGLGDLGLGKLKGAIGGFNGFLGGFLAGSLGGLTKWAEGVGGIFAGVAVVVDKTTKHFSDLYYLQQKLSGTFNGSIGSLMKVQELSQLSGLGPNGLTDQLQTVARQMRDLPKNTILNSIIGNTTDPLTALERAATYYNTNNGKMSAFVARKILDFTGLDPDTIRQLGQNLPQVLPFLNTYSKAMSSLGFSPDQLAQNSVNFQRNITLFDSIIELFVDDVVSKFLPTLNTSLVELIGWINAHSGEINKDIAALPGALETLFKWIHEAIQYLQPFAGDQSGVTPKGTSKPLAAANDVVETIFGILHSIWDPQFLGGKMTPWQQNNVQQNLNKGDAGSAWLLNNVWTPMANWLLERTHSPSVEIYEAKGLWKMFGEWLRGGASFKPYVQVAKGDGSTSTTDLVKSLGNQIQKQDNLPTPSGLPISKVQQDKNIAASMAYFQAKGLTFNQAAGVVGRLYAESGLNPNAFNPAGGGHGAVGIAQWRGDRQNGIGNTLQTQLDAVWSELHKPAYIAALNGILKAKTPYDSATAMENYEKASDPAFTNKAGIIANSIANALARHQGLNAGNNPVLHSPPGTSPVSANGNQIQFNPTSTIHIHGQAGPEIGAKVESSVYRAHAKLFRNFQTQVS